MGSNSPDSDKGGVDSALKIFYLIGVVIIIVVAFGLSTSFSLEENETNSLKDEYDFGQFDGNASENLIGKWKIIERNGHEANNQIYYFFSENNTYSYEVDLYSNFTYIKTGTWKLEEEKNLMRLTEEDSEDENLIYYSFSENGNKMSWNGISSEWNIIFEKTE
ncbi:MAG: lipocalin family protein [Candidatus Thermoplasmatota archaeon]